MNSLFFTWLAQIPESARLPILRYPDEPSSALELSLGLLMVVLVLLIALKVSSRNRIQD